MRANTLTKAIVWSAMKRLCRPGSRSALQGHDVAQSETPTSVTPTVLIIRIIIIIIVIITIPRHFYGAVITAKAVSRVRPVLLMNVN